MEELVGLMTGAVTQETRHEQQPADQDTTATSAGRSRTSTRSERHAARRGNPNSATHRARSARRSGGLALRVLQAQAFQIFLVLLVIILIFSILAPDTFAQWSNFRLIIQNASILAVLAVGMTFVIITAGIDLSIGSVLVFSGVVAAIRCAPSAVKAGASRSSASSSRSSPGCSGACSTAS